MTEDERPADAPGGNEPGSDQLTPEDLMREMARQLAERPVRDFVMQTMATFADLAGIRLGFGPEGPARRDLPQARLAIETLRALVAVIEAEVGAAQARPFREPLAQLQMLYARASEEEASAAASGEAGGDGGEGESGIWTPEDEKGPGQSGLWTPGS